MDPEHIKELQRQALAGEEAKRKLREAGYSLPENPASSQQLPPQTHDQVALPPSIPSNASPAASYPYPSVQSRKWPMYDPTLLPNTRPANRIQQSSHYYSPHVFQHGQSHTRQHEQQMQPHRSQPAQMQPANSVGPQTRNHHHHVQDPSHFNANVAPQQYAQFERMMPYPQQPSAQRQASTMQPSMAARQTFSATQSGSQPRKEQPFDRQTPSHGPPSSMTAIPNTIAATSNSITMPNQTRLTPPHPSSNADVVGKENHEVTSTSTSLSSTAQHPHLPPSSTIANGRKQEPTMTNGSHTHSSSTFSSPADVNTQSSIPAPKPPPDIEQLKRWISDCGEAAAPGAYVKLPNSGWGIIKDQSSRMYTVSPEGRVRLWESSIQSPQTAPRHPVNPDMGNFPSAPAPLPIEQIGHFRSYGSPAQQQTHPSMNHTNISFLARPLMAQQQSRYHPHSVPTQLVNKVATSDQYKLPASSPKPPKQSSSPRTPSQADKRHLAKDILRALKPSALEEGMRPKRPRPENGLANSIQQPPAKRQATGPAANVSSPGSLPSASTSQSPNRGANGVVHRDVAQPSVGEVSAEGELALSSSTQRYPIYSTLPSASVPSAPPPKRPVPTSQPPVQLSTGVPPSTPVFSQMTPELPSSLPPPTQPFVSFPPPSPSTTTFPMSEKSDQHVAEPSFPSTSRVSLPTLRPVARPSAQILTSASEVRSTHTTSMTSMWPAMPPPPPPSGSSSALPTQKAPVSLPRREPLVRSDSVPTIATLPPAPPISVTPVQAVSTAQQASSSKLRSAPKPQQPEERQKTPLFLPSPRSSPIEIIDGTEDATISEDPLQIGGLGDPMAELNFIEERGPQRHKDRGREARGRPYVLVPPLPNYLKVFKANQLMATTGRRTRIRPAGDEHLSELERRSSSRLVEEPDINYADPASFDFVIDDAERRAMLLSCSRISERPCKWTGCNVIMDSAEKLIKHFALEHRPQKTSKNSFVCLWQQCGKRLPDAKKLFIHLRSHATTPLSCGYEDCDESFRNPRQLMKHHKAEHRHDSPKPAATFFTPKLDPLPLAPRILPSYMVEARQVQQPSISKERHAFLSPWVLRKIAGPVNHSMKRYNAAEPLRSANGAEEQLGNQPYDFLAFPSVQYSSAPSQPSKIRSLDDLDSGEVSEMANDGMVLWYAPDVKEEEDSSDEMTQSNSSDHITDEDQVETVLAR